MSLEEKLKDKLQGGKFRLLNEKLYKDLPLTQEEAENYHLYYTNQVSKWPENPRDYIASKIEDHQQSELKIADLGCGDAFLSKKFANVKSFDKYPINESIIKCTLTEINAEDKEFDVALCCLSLMMKYITKVLKEVNRILKIDGIFYLSEVTSRIRNTKKFIDDVEKFGFKLQEVNTKNSHFTSFTFKKVKDMITTKKLPTVSLEPCLYKKR
jgi:ribosomal RNA-processing protein 8